jgi:hypothetical protein
MTCAGSSGFLGAFTFCFQLMPNALRVFIRRSARYLFPRILWIRAPPLSAGAEHVTYYRHRST